MPTPRRRRTDQEPLNPVVGTPATVPSATGDPLKPVESLAIQPTHEDIARRAYQLYEERGGEHGQDLADWFLAERELRQPLRDVVGRILAAEGGYAAA
jgi:hypothetical protein